MPPSRTTSSEPTLSQADKEEALRRRREKRAELAAIRRADVELLKNEGNECFKNGKYEDAITKYEEAILLTGEKPILLSNLAAAQAKLERYKDAIGSATTALLHDPENIKARYRRANARKALKQFPGAYADFKLIHSQDPSLADVKQELDALKPKLREKGIDSDEEFASDVDFPNLDFFPYDDDSDSDTSDCLHFGNDTPCRFYNRGACKKGNKCKFSHAPDDMSVRDELGRNVCIYSLLNACTYGPESCVYTHSREFLPHGWWSTEHDIGMCRTIVENVKRHENAASHKEIAQQLRVSRLGSGFQRRIFSNLGIRSMDVDRKARAKLRASVRARAGNKNIEPVTTSKASTSAAGPAATAKAPTPPPAEAAPFVVVLSLDHQDYYNDVLSYLLSNLQARIEVKQAFNKDTALAYLSQPGLTAVYVMDAGIIKKPNAAVVKRLINFVKNDGGRVCFGGMFPGLVSPNEFAEFFKKFGVQWTYGSYHRTDFALNTSHPLISSNPLLLQSYSMKALHVSNISSDDMIYKPTAESRVQSHVFAPVKIGKLDQSPAVATRVGKGWLSFLGDVNGEKDSTAPVLAMLGILDEIKPVIAQPESTPPGSKTSAKGKSKDSEEVQQNTVSSEFILVIALKAESTFKATHTAQLNALRKKIRVELAIHRDRALQYLSDPNLKGIYIADNSLLPSNNDDILRKVITFLKNGGNVVVGGFFPKFTEPDQFADFFEAFDLKWEAGKQRKVEWYLHPRTQLGKCNPSLPETCPIKAYALTNVQPSEMIYFAPPPEDDGDEDLQDESPVVRTRVGKGHLGYVGFERNDSPLSSKVIFAMFDKLDYTPGPPQPTHKTFVLVLSFDRVEFTKQAYAGLLSSLAEKVEVIHNDFSNERVIDLLRSEDLVGVIITSTGITDPPQAYLLHKLVEYTKNGGTAVFSGFFPSDITVFECKPFFEDNFGLPWDMSRGTSVETKLNQNNELARSARDRLPAQLELGAVCLKGIKESMILYKDKYPVKNRELDAAVAVAPVGKGRVGWLGTTSHVDEGQAKVVLAMLGL